MTDQKTAVDCGQWLLYRYNPERAEHGENPMILDSRTPTKKVQDFLLMETRFKMLSKSNPEHAQKLWQLAQHDADVRYHFYEYLAQRRVGNGARPAAIPSHDASERAREEKPTPVETTK
jgi:pyruvate-ferredoxin/flavodoxin oxidoreductase